MKEQEAKSLFIRYKKDLMGVISIIGFRAVVVFWLKQNFLNRIWTKKEIRFHSFWPSQNIWTLPPWRIPTWRISEMDTSINIIWIMHFHWSLNAKEGFRFLWQWKSYGSSLSCTSSMPQNHKIYISTVSSWGLIKTG